MKDERWLILKKVPMLLLRHTTDYLYSFCILRIGIVLLLKNVRVVIIGIMEHVRNVSIELL